MKRFLIILLMSLVATASYSWDKRGHDASTMIAEKYLTKKARKNISKYLEGHTLTWYASYMDYMGYHYKLGLSNEWFDHCSPVNRKMEYSNGDYDDSGISQKGDAVMCIRKAVDEMKDGGYRNLPDSTVTLYLAWLAHFVPDIHCPSHVIYNFRSTNYWVNVGGGEKVLFHGIWDHVPDRYGIDDWSPGEYCDHLTRNLSRKEVKAIAMDGDVLGWVHQNAVECLVAYDIVRPDTLTDVDCYNATVLADRQLVRGGIRLACLLNMIFG